MSDIRLKKITIEPGTPLVIQNGVTSFNNTTISTSIVSGALVSNGGIAINCSQESSSFSAGGALSIGGGASVMKTLYIGKDTILDSSTGKFKVNGLSQDRFLIDSVTNKQITMSVDGVANQFILTESRLNITTSNPSTNLTTAALVVSGGISINSTEDTVSSTQGGAVTIAGGVSINKSLIVKNTINTTDLILDTHTNDTNGSVMVFQKSRNNLATQNNDTLGEIVWEGVNDSNVSVFAGGITIKQTGHDTNFITGKLEIELVDNTGNVNKYMTINASTSSFLIGSSDVTIVSNNEATGLGTGGSLTIGGGMSLGKKMYMGSSIIAPFNAHTIGNMFMTGGNIGIATTSPNSTLDVVGTIGAVTFTGGNAFYSGVITCGSIIIRDSVLQVDNLTAGNIKNTNITSSALNTLMATIGNLYLTNQTANAIVTSDLYTMTSTLNNILTTAVTSGDIINTGNISTNTLNVTAAGNLKYQYNTIGNLYTFNNFVGINTTTSSYTLDVNGTLKVSSTLMITNSVPSNNSSTGSLVVNGGISISDSTNATSVTSGGGLTIAGGTSIAKDIYVGGIVRFANTETSVSSTYGSVIAYGGISIDSTENATSVTQGGALTIAGGASIAKTIYIGGDIIGINSNSTIASLMVTNSFASKNAWIKSTENSIDVNSGGSLTVAGGTSIAKDVYVGGILDVTNKIVTKSMEYRNTSDNDIIFLDNANNRRFAIDKNESSNNLQIKRYNNVGGLVDTPMSVDNISGKITFNTDILTNGSETFASIQNALGVGSGGNLTVLGGTSISKDVYIGGNTVISSTTPSTDCSTGALIVYGGIAAGKNLNVLGDAFVTGDIYVGGQVISIDVFNMQIQDNIFTLNSGPNGSRDSGFIIQRYQTTNDTGFGDVVNDALYTSNIIPNQSGMTNTEIKFGNTASSVDDYYKGYWLRIASGFGQNQVRKITGYIGSTRVATVSQAWTTQPAIGDAVNLYNKPYVGLVYNEIKDRFEFGATVADPGGANITFTENMPLLVSKLASVSTDTSTNSSTGAIVVSGGISIDCTENATNISSGGAMTIAGGASIAKTLYTNALTVNGVNMTPSASEIFNTVTFNASNNQNVFADITSLQFSSSVWGFDVYLSVRIIATTSLYANFHLRGVNRQSTWELAKTYIGDETGIEFSITNSGQIQYTTSNYSGYVSATMKYRAFVN